MGLAIRTMIPADIPLGLDLCRLSGWNQVEDDWQRLLTLSPESIFIAEYKGKACATACAISYSAKTAWIGMVLVHPQYRRRNIGSSLMQHSIEHLKARGVESIKIDASDQGRPVYLRLGFEDERPLYRYIGPALSGPQASRSGHDITPDLWPSIAKHDRVAFGADRLKLLRLLAGNGISSIVASDSGIQGYGFARKGFHASFIGPIVATDTHTAGEIIRDLLAALPPGEAYWDILPDNVAAKNLAATLGFSLRGRFTRMYLGSPAHVGSLEVIFGTAGLELG